MFIIFLILYLKDYEEKSKYRKYFSESVTVEDRYKACMEEHLGVSNRKLIASRLRRSHTVIQWAV